MYWGVTLQFDKGLSIFLFLTTFSSVAGFCRHWFLYQTTQHHSIKSSGNDEDQKIATLLNIYLCCENFMLLHSNFPETHLACIKYWMWTMQDNRSLDFWLIFGHLVPNRERNWLLWQRFIALFEQLTKKHINLTHQQQSTTNKQNLLQKKKFVTDSRHWAEHGFKNTHENVE